MLSISTICTQPFQVDKYLKCISTSCMVTQISLRAVIHQTDIKELEVTYINCCIMS